MRSICCFDFLRLSCAACVAAVVGACTPAPPLDPPPRVLGVEPSSPVVPVTTTFRVTFSDTLNKKTVSADPTTDNFSVALVRTAAVTEAFVSDLNNPPLSDSRIADIVPFELSYDAHDNLSASILVIAPQLPLAPNVAYSLLIASEVRDPAGNPLVDGAGRKAAFRYDFTTDPGQPQVLSTDAVSAGSPLVVPNRRRINVTFNQPVVGVSADSLYLDGTPAPVIEAVTVDETRTAAQIVLAPAVGGACETLGAATSYTLVATSAISGDNGQALADYSAAFDTGAACDLTANTVVSATSITGEDAATVRFETSKAATTQLRFGAVDGALDCLGAPCPIVGASARSPVAGAVPPRFAHSVSLAGLSVGITYAYVVSAEDDVGQVATRSGTFVTAPLPKVGINEVMANPPNGAPEPRDEYLELVNFGDVDVALAGYALQVNGGDAQGGDTCVLANAPVLPANGFLLLVGADFTAATYGAIDEAALLRGTAASFCVAITNSDAQSFVLADGGGRPISSMTTYGALLPHDEGISVERIAPDAPDTAESYCHSRADVGPTPAAENGAVSRGCSE